MAIKKNLKYFKERINVTTKIDDILSEDLEFLHKLLFFFVLNCPSGYSETYPTSFMSKKFADYGIVAHKKTAVTNEVKKAFKDHYYVYPTNEDISESRINDFRDAIKDQTNYLCIQIDRDGVQLDSIYYKIRNAFSHGSFQIKDNTYVLWNIHNNQLKGMFVIQKNTLTKLIDVVTTCS